MRAVTHARYGPPSVLELSERPIPSIQPHEVLIRVGATEVTKSDCELRKMAFPVQWFTLPLRLARGWHKPRQPVLGGYFAGRIEQVGARVTRFRVGDEVYGSAGMRMGAYAEYMALSESASMAAKPSTLSFVEAAAIPLGALNALHFMQRASLAPGERILIIGAGGSIGSYAVQLAKRRGAEVTAVDAAHKLSWLTSLGADHVLDFAREDALARQAHYDAVFSTIAADHYSRCMTALTSHGRYLTANPRLADLTRSVLTNWRGEKRAIVAFASETIEELVVLRELIEAGELRPSLDSVLPLEAAPLAHERVESESRIGSVVLDLGLG